MRQHSLTLSDLFIKQVSRVNPFIRFYQSLKKNKKKTKTKQNKNKTKQSKTNFSINQIDLNYEKTNK